MYVIQYENSVADYINFNLFHNNNSKSARRIEYFLKFAVPLYLLGFHLFPNFSDRLIISYLLMWIVFSAVFILAIHHLLRINLKLRVKKLYSEGVNKTNIGSHKMTLDENGITDEASNEVTKITWQGVSKISKDIYNIYIYTSAMNAFVIPLKYLGDTNRENEILEYVKSKVNSDDTIIDISKTKKSNGLKKFVGFLISGFGVYLILFPILLYGFNYDNKSASIILFFTAIIGAIVGSKIFSKYSWSVILISFLVIVGCSVLLIETLK